MSVACHGVVISWYLGCRGVGWLPQHGICGYHGIVVLWDCIGTSMSLYIACMCTCRGCVRCICRYVVYVLVVCRVAACVHGVVIPSISGCIDTSQEQLLHIRIS